MNRPDPRPALALLGLLAACGTGPSDGDSRDADDDRPTDMVPPDDGGADRPRDVPGDSPDVADVPADAGAWPCLDPGRGPGGVTVSAAAGLPPVAGGVPRDGAYRLVAVTLYPDAALEPQVTRFAARDNGGTSGALRILDGAWGMTARLDLYFNFGLDGVGGMELDIRPVFVFSGAYTPVEGGVRIDPGECRQEVPTDCGSAEPLEVRADEDGISVTLRWSEACLVRLLPASYRLHARTWIAGDLPVVLRYQR